MYLTQPGCTTFVAHPFAQLWVSGLLFWAILIRTCDDQRMAGTKVQGGLGVIWEIGCFCYFVTSLITRHSHKIAPL